MGARRTRWPHREIAALAERQATMITRAQLVARGVASGSIGSALELGRLYRVHQGVYSIVPAGARPRLAAEQAALLACGATAVLSHRSAAWLHGLIDRQPSPVELTVVGDRARRRPGLVVHRARAMDSADLTRIGSLPATSVARTVLDLSPALADVALEPMIDRALRGTSRSAFLSTLGRAEGRPGAARVRALLDPARPSARTRSRAERRLLDLIRAGGLPAPECDVPLGDHGRIPDLLWREQKVIVEFDSWEYHSGPASFHDDRARHNELTAQGYQIIHVTWRVLRDRPEQVLVWIAAALARSGP
ncbi:MAG TPA: type IV toxin-antitoxin system AbiEi family antitoxin domain-containing protein [Solirubrobacteraceae bacterium]|nr:type IV toxin-antitoxin system AbiEi family antitoxin domain-containing protein [Solirubrobacteraceae bacterium]